MSNTNKPHPFVGTRRRFTYPPYEGVTDGGTVVDNHPEYTAHTGQLVTVTRQLTDEECDPECQPMLEFRADDGFVGHAHASELDGTVRPLRPQDHKYAVPEGTGERRLTTKEIDAAIANRFKPEYQYRLDEKVKVTMEVTDEGVENTQYFRDLFHAPNNATAVNRALKLLRFIVEPLLIPGTELLQKNPDGTVDRIVIPELSGKAPSDNR